MARFRVLAAVTVAMIADTAAAAHWEARPGQGDRILVHVFKKGVFSAFAHDHHFEVTEWRATADVPDGKPGAASVDVVLSADSLRDRQKSLSEENRRKVDRQAAGPDVLDSEHHPRIEFRAQRFEADPGGDPQHLRGKMSGMLTVRGKSVPAALAVEAVQAAGAWLVRGTTRVKQTALGIKPFSGFGGTVGVKDEIEIEFALALRPRAG